MQPPIKSNGKLLLACQYWGADADQMRHLLKLMADMEDGICPYADILLFPRADTKERRTDSWDHLNSKFSRVLRERSKRANTGWPHGPNAVAMDVFRHIHGVWQSGLFEWDACMLVEADCVPLKRLWHKDILDEWHSQKGLALGHWDGSGTNLVPPNSHMNGNLVFHPELVSKIPELGYGDVPRWGWDMAFWPKIAPYATPSRVIYSDYKLNTPVNPLLNAEQLFAERVHSHKENPLYGQKLKVSYLHGCKGLKGIEYARDRFLST